MRNRLELLDPVGPQPDPVSEMDGADVTDVDASEVDNGPGAATTPAATATPATAAPDVAPAAVLPSPLHFLAAGTGGGLAGLFAVYLVASKLAGTLDAVAAVIMIFAVTMSGPWVHARADSELGRVIAVALQSVAFGAALGALLVMS